MAAGDAAARGGAAAAADGAATRAAEPPARASRASKDNRASKGNRVSRVRTASRDRAASRAAESPAAHRQRPVGGRAGSHRRQAAEQAAIRSNRRIRLPTAGNRPRSRRSIACGRPTTTCGARLAECQRGRFAARGRSLARSHRSAGRHAAAGRLRPSELHGADGRTTGGAAKAAGRSCARS